MPARFADLLSPAGTWLRIENRVNNEEPAMLAVLAIGYYRGVRSGVNTTAISDAGASSQLTPTQRNECPGPAGAGARAVGKAVGLRFRGSAVLRGIAPMKSQRSQTGQPGPKREEVARSTWCGGRHACRVVEDPLRRIAVRSLTRS